MAVLKALFFLGLSLFGSQALAAADIVLPKALEPWRDWVLAEHPQYLCSSFHDQSTAKVCAWPGELALELDDQGGRFTQSWHLDAAADLELPGDASAWPHEVEVNGQPQPVVARNGRPSLHLKQAGEYHISGRLRWAFMPERLGLPRGSALLALRIKGAPVAFPRFAGDDLLLAEQGGQMQETKGVTDTLELQVYRLLDDEIPFMIETRIHLLVTGAGRELELGNPLLIGSSAVDIQAPFPVRLEADGRLRAQVRPGRWELRIEARMPGEVNELKRPDSAKPWPEQEVWSLKRQPNIRTLEFAGLTALDVSSIPNYPQDWRGLPSLLAPPGALLQLVTKGRGEISHPPLLNVERDLWLDFDGQGFTSQDRIKGQVKGGRRIEADVANELGRLEINGTPRFITRNETSKQLGTELRENQLNLLAEGRMTGPLRAFPVLGWDFEAQSLGLKLHLPPGYRLLHAAGVDEVQGSWVARWNLWDFFLVLLVGISFWNLFGPTFGVLALLALGLGYQEQGAPGVLWLPALLSIGLLRLLPEGRLAVWIGRIKYLALALLLLQLLPFAVDQVRMAIYPQLERNAGFVQRLQQAAPAAMDGIQAPAMLAVPAPAPEAESAPVSAPSAAMKLEADAMVAVQPKARVGLSARGSINSFAPERSTKGLKRDFGTPLDASLYDPDVKVQSGPGLPQWRWNSYDLRYSGGVTKDQRLQLQLIAPAALRLLRLLVVGLFGLLLLGLITDGGKRLRPMARVLRTQPQLLLLGPLLCLLLSVMPVTEARAAEAAEIDQATMPPQYLLEQLDQRLQRPDDCFPQCAELASLRLDMDGNSLRMQLEIHVSKDATAVPLVGRFGEWLPQRVEEASSQAPLALQRHEDGSLRVRLDRGVHRLLVLGSLDAGALKQGIFVPMAARYVEINNPQGQWLVSGLEQQQLPGHYLGFSQQTKTQEERLPALEPTSLPPQLRVERSLRLDRELLVNSRLVRQSPPGSALDIWIPLLAGEHLLSKAEVAQGRIHVQLAPGETEFSWESRMEQSDELALAAPPVKEAGQDWNEYWTLGYSSLWLLAQDGPAPTRTFGNGRFWNAIWQPYPGEHLRLVFARPKAAEGRVTTVTRLDAGVTPGERMTQVRLGLDVRSTQADRLQLRLPDDARLLALLVDGQKRGAEIQEGQLHLDTEPGKHRFDIQLATGQGLGLRTQMPAIGFDSPYVNENLSIALPLDRWVLFVHGPNLGPAVLFWGVLLVMLAVAWGLGRLRIPQVRGLDWYLLAIGFASVSLLGLLLLVAWFLALRWRSGQDMASSPRWKANLIQFALVLFTLVVALQMLDVVQTGMLGYPDMQISGNASNAQQLNWYRDRSAGGLGEAWVLSLPIWAYRLAMLLWSLWLALAVVRWARFAWGAWSHGGYWNLGVPAPESQPGSQAGTPRRPGRQPPITQPHKAEDEPTHS